MTTNLLSSIVLLIDYFLIYNLYEQSTEDRRGNKYFYLLLTLLYIIYVPNYIFTEGRRHKYLPFKYH